MALMQYVIREQSSLLSREMVIEDHRGHTQFKVHGPLVRLRDELRLDDAKGVEQAWIEDPVLGDSSAYEIYRGGAHVADVRMVGVGNLLEGYDINVSGGQSLQARGDMFGREYTISHQGQRAAKVKRRDSKAIEVETEGAQDEVLLLAGVVAMSAMTDIWARTGRTKTDRGPVCSVVAGAFSERSPRRVHESAKQRPSRCSRRGPTPPDS